MKLLADMGLKENLFLVTGAKADGADPSHGHESPVPDGSHSPLVSFHHRYTEHQGVNASPVEGLERSDVMHLELSDVDPDYCDGQTYRPEGVSGVFVSTFAKPDTARLSVVLAACSGCRGTEADTLMVELANALDGSVTVCTGDSDLVAILTASGREGVTLRLENRSYRADRAMHDSLFGELMFESALAKCDASRGCSTPRTSGDWFLTLSDLDGTGEDHRHLLPDGVAERHSAFESVLEDRGGDIFKYSTYEYLYRSGIRGSVYIAFLNRFFESDAQTKLDQLSAECQKLARSAGNRSADAVHYVFEILCGSPEVNNHVPTSRRPAPPDADTVRASKDKRMRFHEVEDVEATPEPEPCSPNGSDTEAALGKARSTLTSGLKRMTKAYARGAIPVSGHVRYLKLAQSGRHLFLQVKPQVLKDESVRLERLLFMALCGTDYSLTPVGLGIKRLLTGAVVNREAFSAWCAQLGALLWPRDGKERDTDRVSSEFESVAVKLASLTGVPKGTCSRHWTGPRFDLICRTLKYVCDLWFMKRPRFRPEYGFVVHEGVVRFIGDTQGPTS